MIFILFILIIALLVVNIRLGRYGKKFYWVFELSHFLMGFLLASFVYVVFAPSSTRIILTVFCVGIVWEVWEYLAHNTSWVNVFIKKHFNYFTDRQTLDDTILDLVLDMAGALCFVALYPLFL